MTDPKRLLEQGGDDFEMRLLRSVEGDGMSSPSRQRILGGLGLAGAIATGSTTAASAAGAAKAGLFKGAGAAAVKWITVLSIASAVPAGVWVARSRHSALARPTPVATQVGAPIGAVRPFVQPAEPAPAELPAQPRADTPAPVVAPPRETKTATAPTLADEVSALQAARTALADRDAVAALSALDRYKGRFPAARLAPEATVLRIEALVLRGDRAQASTLADRFESSHPRSPYTARIRAIVGQ